jgi:triosephosphate isomerase
MITLVANWKLYVRTHRSVTYARLIARRYGGANFKHIRQILCPSLPILEEVGKAIHRTRILLGAQNIGSALNDAATGEVAARDVRAVGCRYVILGHSERRARGETDEIIAQKLRAAVRVGLTPILCVGEPLAVRRRGAAARHVRAQLHRAIRIDPGRGFLLAYEPVWAISLAGKSRGACPPATAHAMREVILRSVRALIPKRRPLPHVLYGGSVTGQNVADYIGNAGFRGALVGFASTKMSEYATMMKVLSQARHYARFFQTTR